MFQAVVANVHHSSSCKLIPRNRLRSVHKLLTTLDIYFDCYYMHVGLRVIPLEDRSGYAYCITVFSGIVELCPPGTEVSFEVGGCVNKTSK